MTTTAGETRTRRSKKTAASARQTTSRESGSSRTRKATTSGARTSARAEHKPRTARLNLPGMSAEFRAPQLRDLPSPGEVVRAAGAAPRQVARAAGAAPHQVARAAGAATTLLPPRDRLLYYGGLGAAAVLGVIEWPVAVAVGAGMAIAQRSPQEGTARGRRTSRRTESTES